jgi:hypothetical protein
MRSIILKGFVPVVVTALLSGILYEQIGRRPDRKRIPRIGRPVDIGGRALNIYCSGTGSPKVIFESGSPGNLYRPKLRSSRRLACMTGQARGGAIQVHFLEPALQSQMICMSS